MAIIYVNYFFLLQPKTKSKRKQATTAQSASKSILQKYKNAQVRFLIMLGWAILREYGEHLELTYKWSYV